MKTLLSVRLVRSFAAALVLGSLGFSGVAFADGKGSKTAPSATKAEDAPTEFEVKVREIVGTKKEGWMPKAVTGLKRGMAPADVATKGIFGAGNISEFGFAEASLENAKPGLQSLQLYYKKDKAGEWRLLSVAIRFDTSFEFSDILAVCQAKYGKARPADREKQIVTWVGAGMKSVQLHKSFAEGASYELSVWL